MFNLCGAFAGTRYMQREDGAMAVETAGQRWPDFFVVGAPKAGTTALNAALAQHPQLYLSPVKEPKYFLCDERPPPRGQHRGPGDAHSRKEWIWRRSQYLALFDDAPTLTLRGESTPFYLYERAAHDRIERVAPKARLIAVLRDPVDRAYSNWMHLRSDGLETDPDFLSALHREPERIRAGYAPFWHYQGLGRYAEQLRHLYRYFPPEQVHVLRYRDLVDTPAQALSQVWSFLGVEPVSTQAAPRENVKPFVPASRRNDALRRVIRVGASVGQIPHPATWRRAESALLQRLYAGGTIRPQLPPEQRLAAVELFADDIRELGALLGRSFDDWLGASGRGSFEARVKARTEPATPAPATTPDDA